MSKTAVTPKPPVAITVRSSKTTARDAELDALAAQVAADDRPLTLRGLLLHYNPATVRYVQWNAVSWNVQITPADADTANTIGQVFGAFWDAVGTGRLEELGKVLKDFVARS